MTCDVVFVVLRWSFNVTTFLFRRETRCTSPPLSPVLRSLRGVHPGNAVATRGLWRTNTVQMRYWLNEGLWLQNADVSLFPVTIQLLAFQRMWAIRCPHSSWYCPSSHVPQIQFPLFKSMSAGGCYFSVPNWTFTEEKAGNWADTGHCRPNQWPSFLLRV